MANYCGTSRTNYFKVRDGEAFKKWAEGLHLDVAVGHVGEKEGKFALFPSRNSDDGCFPDGTIYDEATDEDRDFDFAAELSKHLAEGEVAVHVHIGAEKLRYLLGYAVAVNHRGETVEVNIDEIYKLADTHLGVLPTRAEY